MDAEKRLASVSLLRSGQERPDDMLLLQALAQGDEGALFLLHDQYAGRILTLARREGLSDPAQALEDAFMLIYRSAECFARSELEPSSWIIGMAFWQFRRMSLDNLSSP